ncbi:PREDICTED: toll-like receptor 13 [Nanorana parkeri]|uniref:toll-like receptor 13 n=1 Tax=Nanorana parkeri TaxID=125878 RepID=UPI000854D6BF|nr:PREDICTED: toll-like receptor 13 [Nanorana parkeri]
MFLSLAWIVMFSSIQQGHCFAIRGCDVHGQQNPKLLCYGRGLEHVPDNLPRTTSMLDISSNRIEVIKATDFSNVTHLQQLNASNNHIQVVEKGSFQMLTALNVLNLNHNNLMMLNNNIFEGLQNISILLLNNNNITSILPMAFSPIENLKVLDLSANPLQTLGSLRLIFQISSLEEIRIANISLENFLSSDIQNVSISLHTIDISINPLASVIFNSDVLTGLTSLNISFSGPSLTWKIEDSCFLRGLKKIIFNGVSLSPPAILEVIQTLNCSSLQEVNLDHLNLTDSDNIIQELCMKHPKIQTLSLQYNNYSAFQINSFQKCSGLKYLDISFNQFLHVPASAFAHLTSLKQLTLVRNRITALPSDLSQMTSLERMNLSFNHLTEVYLNDTKSFGKLKNLDLSGNKISVFHSSAPVMWKLEDLNLGLNYLIDISESFGTNLRKVKSLILRTNKLSYLSANTFQNLINLTFLNLIDNQIIDIEPGAFNGSENLYTLLLGSNKLTTASFEKNTFQGLESLVELQLFSNDIEYESSEKLTVPPFHSLKSLKILTLNSQGHNGMRNVPVNLLEGLVSLHKVLLGNLALTTIDKNLLSYIPQLKEFDLGDNNIPVLDLNLLKSVPNLTELHLKKMTLTSLDFLVGLNLSKLNILRASGNQLNFFNETHHNAMPSLKFLDLRDNPMFCNCDNNWFIHWVQDDLKTQVLNFYEYQCTYPPSNKGQRLYTFNTDYCRPSNDLILFLSTSVFISVWLLSSTVWKFWRWHVVYFYYIFLGYLHEKKHKRKSQHYEYDAFISYNCHDEEWVFNELIPSLEKTYQRKLCLHHRDFEPGKAIVDNIIDNIYCSRKTICVISRHYLDSEWCSKEMQIASYRLFDEHADVLILLFLEQISHHRLSLYHQFRSVVKKKTYLLWPKDINATAVFWHMVNQALTEDEVLEVKNAA